MEAQSEKLIRFCDGLLADGVIDDKEVALLAAWLKNNPGFSERFPGAQIAARIKRIYEDGKVTNEERQELLKLLMRATRRVAEDVNPPQADAVSLALTELVPQVEFLNKHFCLLGTFVSGTPAWCARQIEQRGGELQSTPNIDTDYVVIGSVAGPAASEAKSCLPYLSKLMVISEETWASALNAARS